MIKQNTSNTAQALWIGIGSLFSFLFSIISSAILSRYLTKGDYGSYKQVMYVYNTLLSVFTLGLPLAYSYFLPRVSLSEGKSLVNRLNKCFVILGFFFSATLYFGADLFSEILKNPALSVDIKIFSPAPLLILPTMGLQGILATYKKTLLNAVYVISTRVLMLIFVALPVMFIKASVEVAIWGFIVSSAISCVLALIFKNIPFRNITRQRCKVTHYEIFAYSFPLMIAGLLGIFISAADQFYVSRYFGQEVFAEFANGSLELPFVGMVLSAGSTVLLPVFSKLISDKAQKEIILELWERTAIKASLILYPLIVFCIFFSTDIMTFLYGSTYSTSAIYFRIMLLANFFTVVQFYPIILALGKTKEYAIIHIVVLLLVWVGEFIAVRFLQTAVYITVISVLCKILKMLLMMRIVADSIQINVLSLFPIKQLLKNIFVCLLAGIISFYIVKSIHFDLFLLIKLSFGFLLYSVVVFFVGRNFKVDYLSVIRPLTERFKKE